VGCRSMRHNETWTQNIAAVATCAFLSANFQCANLERWSHSASYVARPHHGYGERAIPRNVLLKSDGTTRDEGLRSGLSSNGGGGRETQRKLKPSTNAGLSRTGSVFTRPTGLAESWQPLSRKASWCARLTVPHADRLIAKLRRLTQTTQSLSKLNGFVLGVIGRRIQQNPTLSSSQSIGPCEGMCGN
jgi:hypothetical protein